jgi:hypothetical protein
MDLSPFVVGVIFIVQLPGNGIGLLFISQRFYTESPASITVQNMLTRTFSQANLGKMAIRAVL